MLGNKEPCMLKENEGNPVFARKTITIEKEI